MVHVRGAGGGRKEAAFCLSHEEQERNLVSWSVVRNRSYYD